MNALPPAIFLMGPTAAGKTDLAIELTKVLPCELISVDSALVYRGMDIGTAKPSKTQLAEHPHRLIDILDPAQSYSAADFRSDALAAMAEITARGNIPLLVGGTMLYFKALLDGLADMPAADAQVRAQLEADAQAFGWQALHDQLAVVDPVNRPVTFRRWVMRWRSSRVSTFLLKTLTAWCWWTCMPLTSGSCTSALK